MNTTSQNWNYSFYRNHELKAFISYVASPKSSDFDEVKISYAITLTDFDDNEVFQQNFNDLESSITSLNSRYHEWEFVDLSIKSDSGGCSSCEAH